MENSIVASPNQTSGPEAPELSIILPCYNAGRIVRASIASLVEYLSGLGRSWEILPIDDGSKDSTAQLLRDIPQPPGGRIAPILNPDNRGKGSVVRQAMLAAKGNYRIFLDVDLDYRPAEIGKVLLALEGGADVAVASRVAAGAVLTLSPWHLQYMYTRHLASRFLNRIFQWFFVPGLTDSQAGLKGFTARAAQEVFSHTTISGFSFDIEALFVARRLGLRIHEVPVHCIYGEEPSTVNFLKDAFGLVRDMVLIRRRHRAHRYAGQSHAVSASSRRLVVTADDYGLSEWANRGIMQAAQAGAITSVSVMASRHLSPWPADAGEMSFGLHLNLTEGEPWSGAAGLEPILNACGQFAGLPKLTWAMVRKKVSPARLLEELQAQADAVRAAGFAIHHIDGHEHVQHLPVLRQAVAELAAALEVKWVRVSNEPFRFEPFSGATLKKLVLWPFVNKSRKYFAGRGIRSAGRFFGVSLVRPANFSRSILHAMTLCRDEVSEFSLHVAVHGGEEGDRLGHWRSDQLEWLLSADLPRLAREMRLELSGFPRPVGEAISLERNSGRP